MAYVVTENCLKCRFTDCVLVCPVDCFYGDEQMLYIDPEECIDCGACAPACPVEAIYEADELPAAFAKWEEINEERVQDNDTYSIITHEPALPTAERRMKEIQNEKNPVS
jgi:ferredoxin